MNIKNDQIRTILYKHVRQITLTDAEQAIVNKWLQANEYNRQVFSNIHSADEFRYYLEGRVNKEKTENAFNQFKSATQQNSSTVAADFQHDGQTAHRARFMATGGITAHWLRWTVAAAIFVLLGAGTYHYFNQGSQKIMPPEQIPLVLKDIQPATQGAILRLGNGKKMVLDSLANGLVAVQNGVQVLLKNGSLTYENKDKTNDEVLTNTITTPNGRQFQLTLPDGTLVWLNSASSITYPTVFTGNKREVEITGELYFEVAKNTAMPFNIKINKEAEVEVLGTHFNINAYTDESSINTTLLEGAVKVSSPYALMQLLPGQQARLTKDKKIQLVKDADIRVVMAWKNGLFNFDGAGLEQVMRQLSRWYDIRVSYEKNIPAIEFEGEMDRTVNLGELLKGLEGFGIHFRLEENRRLVVLP